MGAYVLQLKHMKLLTLTIIIISQTYFSDTLSVKVTNPKMVVSSW
jgi:hypothetical protein